MLMWIIIFALLAIGLLLIIAEIIFIPGTTVVGLLGFAFAAVGVVISYRHFGSDIGFYILIGMSATSLVTLIYGFRSKSWSKFSLKTSIDSKVNEGMMTALAIGEEGKTISTLRPIGKAEFQNRQFEVKTTGDYLETGMRIRITQIQSHQITVEPIN
jgi:membrane-bound ClpP family serine protease